MRGIIWASFMSGFLISSGLFAIAVTSGKFAAALIWIILAAICGACLMVTGTSNPTEDDDERF